MSGDGDHSEKEFERIKKENEPGNRQSRPRTARSDRRRRPSSPQGAVGGEGSHTRHLTEEEKTVGSQAQFLLEMFIKDRAGRDLSRDKNDIVQDAISQFGKESQSDTCSRSDQINENLDDVSKALRDIGDQLNEDYDLNRLIDMVVVRSPRDIFMKVCKQIFEDNQFNWGRVAAVFYFAYKLITKAVSSTVEKGIPWIKEIISWSMDFIYQYVIWWVVQRGGWIMIKEYFGTSIGMMCTLSVAAFLTILYTLWKQK